MKILIIEDDNTINDLLKELLEKDYLITQAFSGTEGLRLVQEENFDLILLDIMLPGISGKSFIQEAKKVINCPIIVISALSDINQRIEVLEMGADDYITKPFDNREVMARVGVQLRKHQTLNNDEILSVNNTTYDAFSHTVYVDDKALNLTVKELEMLVLFLRNPNRVITKAALYETVWKETYYGDDNTLSVHVSRIRKTLNDARAHRWKPSKKCIESWGNFVLRKDIPTRSILSCYHIEPCFIL